MTKTESGKDQSAVLLTPYAITKDSLNLVLDAGWISKDDLCKGADAGTVAVCK